MFTAYLVVVMISTSYNQTRKSAMRYHLITATIAMTTYLVKTDNMLKPNDCDDAINAIMMMME
jgi:hypothetical protein